MGFPRYGASGFTAVGSGTSAFSAPTTSSQELLLKSPPRAKPRRDLRARGSSSMCPGLRVSHKQRSRGIEEGKEVGRDLLGSRLQGWDAETWAYGQICWKTGNSRPRQFRSVYPSKPPGPSHSFSKAGPRPKETHRRGLLIPIVWHSTIAPVISGKGSGKMSSFHHA